MLSAAALALSIALLPVGWAATMVFGGVVAVLTLLRPQLALLLVVVSVPFGSAWQIQAVGARVGLTEALVAWVLVAWLARMASRRAMRVQFPPLMRWLVFFLGASLLSVFHAASLELGLKEIAKWAEMLGLALFVAHEIRGAWVKVVAASVLGVAAASALLGIYQFLFRVGPEGFVLFGRFMRAYGTFEQPNPYAGYLGLVVPVALGLLFASLSLAKHRARWAWTLGAALCASLTLVALVMSWSRGAWMGVAAALAAMALAAVVRGGRAPVMLAVAAGLGAYVLLTGALARIAPFFVQRLTDFAPFLAGVDVRSAEVTDANFAVLERMSHWLAAWGMWTDRPWSGVGIGNYVQAYPAYALAQWPDALGHAHNFYLNVAAEAGVVGLAAYVALWLRALWDAWVAARRARGWDAGLALGILGAFVHLCVHNLFDNLYVHGIYLYVAVLMGLIPHLARRVQTADAVA